MTTPSDGKKEEIAIFLYMEMYYASAPSHREVMTGKGIWENAGSQTKSRYRKIADRLLDEYIKSPAQGKVEQYPCHDCGKLRTKEEGGTTFTVCDDCWDKAYPKQDHAKENEVLREALKEAKKCIEDAIYSEDGCDGQIGQDVIKQIEQALKHGERNEGN